MRSDIPGRVGIQRLSQAAAWLLALAVAAAQTAAALSRPLPDRLADLHVYLASAQLLRDGGSLYDFAAANGAPFTYPPFAGLVFIPLTLVDETVLRVAWSLLTVAAVCWLAALIAPRASLTRPAAAPAGRLPARLATPVIAALLFASAPVSSNIRFGQVSVLLVLLVVLDVCVLAARRGAGAGVATGVAAAIKLTPLLFVPFLFLARRQRAALTAVVTFVGCGLLAWLVLPGESRRYWLHEIWDVNRVGHITTGGNQSINGALLRLSTPDGVRSALVGVLGLVVAVLAVRRAVRAARAGGWLVAVTVVGAATVVISPVSWTHHQVWLVIAALVPVAPSRTGGGSRWPRLAWFAVAAAVMVAPVTSFGSTLPGILGQFAGDLRLLLAIAVACAVPFQLPQAKPPLGNPGRGVADHPVARSV